MLVFKIFFILISLVLVSFLTSNTLAHSEIQIIEMTSSGFSPIKVEVDNNQTIIFLNKDSIDRWPASDIHPTHDIYPEFDSQKPIQPKKSWSFKPKMAGVWKYHDHINPHMGGVITVVKETQGNIFFSIKDWFSGFISRFKNLFEDQTENTQSSPVEEMAKKEGAIKTWEYFKENNKGQVAPSGNIHDIAHLIGGLIFTQKGFQGLSSCSEDFAFGCYHGFLDTAFKENLDHLLDAQNACLKLGIPDSGPVGSCIHGIGHGVASFFKTSSLDNALASCDRLTSGSQFCFDGVFMEFSRSAPLSFYQNKSSLFPCDSIDEKYVSSCGRNIPATLLNRLGFSFDKVISVCLNSDSIPIKQSCIDALGFLTASQALDDPERIIEICGQIKDPQYNARCLQSASGELIFQNSPKWRETSPTICQAVEDPYKAECENYLQRLISDYKR